MIRNEAEYQEASTRLAEERTRLAEHRGRLKDAGLKDDEIKRIDPMESFHLQLQEEVESYERMKRGIVEGRSAIQGLRSSGSQSSDLVGALSRIQEELEVPPDIDFRVMVTGRQRQLPREIQDEIYRIGREALVNALCHSGAKRVELELEYSDTELYVRIRDNGCGINPEMLEKGRGGHWGLAGMRERTARIGGVLKILSSPAAGTEVQLSIPISLAPELSLHHHSSG
jgi:signal transduction histidine kinase